MTGSDSILVLSISVGQGRRRAALALQEALGNEDPLLRIVYLDLLELWPSGSARRGAILYRGLVRAAVRNIIALFPQADRGGRSFPRLSG